MASQFPITPQNSPHAWAMRTKINTKVFASRSGGMPFKQGTGKNRKNGNIFERWKCFDCQGFGMKSCPSCGKGGLTPEQRGER
ncbi:uncharacterized protein LOC109829405 isoform X2 [Asparagus officinalis]|uniref:uncharacterized protein LOC109829405 isoform X2 n=1 Tax=Asparagus officinalis TaxID=4686 RepID=UPI00098E2AB3|nr:uncharacterized protein LOC109829405 isoform X2 [Asparagus officinalis]